MQISYQIQSISGHNIHWNNSTPIYLKSKKELMNTIMNMKYNNKINNIFVVTASYDEYNVLDGEIIIMFKIEPDDRKEFIYIT